MFAIGFRDCNGKIGNAPIDDDNANPVFLNYVSLLFAGQDLNVLIPGTEELEHTVVVGVMLQYKPDLDVTDSPMHVVASAYLACPDAQAHAEEDKAEAAKSRLILPAGVKR